MKKFVLLLPVLLAACGSTATTPSPSGPDAQYLQATSGSNQFEIQSSQLALNTSSTDAVRTFAQQMIGDHTSAQAQLVPLAAARNVALPDQLPPDLQLKITTLSRLSGSDFDTAYAREQVLAHQLTLSVQQNELRVGQDSQVTAYASAQVPVITMHLQMAQALPGATTTP